MKLSIVWLYYLCIHIYRYFDVVHLKGKSGAMAGSFLPRPSLFLANLHGLQELLLQGQFFLCG